jgi:hypothetical protein
MGRAVGGQGTGARRTTALADVCRLSGFTATTTVVLLTVTAIAGGGGRTSELN